MARRPSVASREKDPAAAGMRRYFSLEQQVEKKISALVVVVVVVARLLIFFLRACEMDKTSYSQLGNTRFQTAVR